MRPSVEIARLEEARQAVAVAELADEHIGISGGTVCFSGAGSWMNQAQGLGLSGGVTSEEIDQLVEFYTSRGVEPKIEVCCFTHHSLTQGLEERGFTLLEFENV